MTRGGLPRVGPPQDLDRIVMEACDQAGVRTGRLRLLRHFANAVYLIEDEPIVARVAYGRGVVGRSRTAVTIARWLAAQGFPATEPVMPPSGADQPIVVEASSEVAVTFWRYYPQPPNQRLPDLRALGTVARVLHALDAPPPIPLPDYQPLRSIATAVQDAEVVGGIDGSSLEWLDRRIGELRQEYAALEFPLGVGLIHADVYVGNLLWSGDSRDVVLGDWDSVCLGPREVDLAPTFTATRFGLDPAALDQFIRSYGYDLRTWAGYPTLRAMRELSTLTALVRLTPVDPSSAQELQHRLDTLQRGDSAALWTRQ